MTIVCATDFYGLFAGGGRVATEHGIATHASVLEGRFAAEAILQAAKRLDVDAARPVLIVHTGGAS